MDLESILFNRQLIKDNGSKVKNLAKEKLYSKAVVFLKDLLRMI